MKRKGVIKIRTEIATDKQLEIAMLKNFNLKIATNKYLTKRTKPLCENDKTWL